MEIKTFEELISEISKISKKYSRILEENNYRIKLKKEKNIIYIIIKKSLCTKAYL